MQGANELLGEPRTVGARTKIAAAPTHPRRAYGVHASQIPPRRAFVAFAGFPPILSDGVNKCLAAARGGSGVAKVEGLEDVLRELAERGFAAIPSRDDPRAEVVSENNVGGVVPRGASAPGLPRAAWATGAKFVLAASSQSMRLLLASELAPDPRPNAPSLWRRLWPF